MAWLRVDDGYDSNHKIMELREVERWRWTRVLIYCAKHRTEGRVTLAVVKELGLAKTVGKLVAVGLLDATDDAKKFQVHDWDQYNPKDPTKADRQARWRAKQPSTSDGPVDAHVDGDVDSETVSRAQARARVPSPTHTPTPEDQSSGLALPAVDLRAFPNYEGHEYKLWKRLCVAAGVAAKPKEITKLENVVKAHRSTERELVMAIEAATGPGVNDPLAVALAELKNLALERKRGAA